MQFIAFYPCCLCHCSLVSETHLSSFLKLPIHNWLPFLQNEKILKFQNRAQWLSQSGRGASPSFIFSSYNAGTCQGGGRGLNTASLSAFAHKQEMTPGIKSLAVVYYPSLFFLESHRGIQSLTTFSAFLYWSLYSNCSPIPLKRQIMLWKKALAGKMQQLQLLLAYRKAVVPAQEITFS